MPELPPLPPGFSLDQQAGPIMGPPPKPPAPRDPLEMEKDRIDIQKGMGDLQTLPLDIESKQLDIEKKRAEAARGPVMSEEAQKLAAKRAALTALEGQINRVDELYRNGFKDESFGILSSLSEYLPTDEAAQLNAAGAGLAEQGLAAFRVPGVGSQSDTELRQFVEANRPSSWDRDSAVEEKLRQLKARVDATRAEMGLPPAQWFGSQQQAPVEQQQGIPSAAPPPPVPGTEQATQSRNLAEIEAPSADMLAPSQGTQTVTNPELAGVRGEYLRRLESGESAGAIIRFLRSAGISDPKILQSAIQQVQYRRQYPNVPIGNYNTTALDQMDVPLSATESMLNSAAQSGPGAYAMNAGQAASFNTLDEIAGATGGNAERVNIALDDSRRNSPVASTLGGISGSVMGALGSEASLARAGMGAGIKRAALADVAYGAGSGAGGAEEGQRASGAITGASLAGAGSLGGAAITKGIGSAISPTGGKLSDLYEAGVRPTPGQRMMAAGDGRGLSGLVGRVVGTTEEAIGSIPIVGAGIRGARQEARDQFQIGAYNQALKEIGTELPKGTKPGTAPYAFTKKAFNEAYDKARSGMRVAPDEELASEVGELSRQIGNLAEPSIKRFENIVTNVLMRRTSDVIDGANFKKIQSELGKVIAGIRKSPSGDGELADALGELQGILDRAARRHSDPAAVAALDAADAGYSKFVRIRDAAKSRGGPAAEFSPTQFDRSVQRMSPGQHSDAYLRGDALMQDYAQQGMALADRLPNSGTADRVMTGTVATGAAAGAGAFEPTSLSVLGILGALYAPGVRKATTGAMAPRGPAAKKVADEVRKRARIAGATGAGLALSGQKDDDR